MTGACAAAACWATFTYPRFSYIDLSFKKSDALRIAREFVRDFSKINPDEYRQAIVFASSTGVDRYLQKAIGYRDEIKFLEKCDYDLFYWKVRFFRENEEEGYRVTVSASTGQVVGYKHVIKETDARPKRSEKANRDLLYGYLQSNFGIDPTQYDSHSDLSVKHEKRTDKSFSWERKDVFVRWSDQPGTGGAKLLTGGTVAGDEILSFYKNKITIPSGFGRYIARQKTVGRNLGILFRILYYVLLSTAIFYAVVRRDNLVMHSVKRFALGLTAFLFVLHLAAQLNFFENIIYSYRTTSSFVSYIWRYASNLVLDTFIVTIAILMPTLAGESLHYEVFGEKHREGAFLHFIRSTFLSRQMLPRVALGYLGAVILIGLQSAIFELGQRFCGVWTEQTWMAQMTGCYLPFLSAFIVGASAALTEEISFRLFSISLIKRWLKSTVLAVLISSVIWGFGHTTYLIFPMWFRGVEVTLLGFFIAFLYLRFGIIPAIVAHYLFDVFWNTSPHILGKATTFDFTTSLAMLFLPLVFGLLAYLVNRPEREGPLVWKLNRHHLFNLEVPLAYLNAHPELLAKPETDLKSEIVAHGWDTAVVEAALKRLRGRNPEDPD